MGRMMIDRSVSDPGHKVGLEMLLKDPPSWKGDKIDLYYWFWGVRAFREYAGPDAEAGLKWLKETRTVLVESQNSASKGERAGSWEPVSRWSGEGGRVFMTALGALTLEAALERK